MREPSAVLLGSGSPRRRELLEAAGFDVEVRRTGADESWPEDLSANTAVIALARRKLEALGPSVQPALTADTVVFLDERPLNKPVDFKHAAEMLRELSGRAHEVVTAFCVRKSDGQVVEDAVTTRVWFRPLVDDEIDRYVATGESMDKAGAYGIQGVGGALVDRVEGSYTNVIGLPLAEVVRVLERPA
ncbi:MAG: Maf family protein [Myxococcota bacterium]